MEVDKGTKFTLSIETAISVAVTIFMVVGLWFNLQADIELAKELPPAEVGRMEYDLKDQLVRETIMNTQKDVEGIKKQLDKIEERLFELK